MLPVIFRKFHNEIIALFPTELGSVGNLGSCMSYQTIGQHGAADYNGIIANSKPATPIEYDRLLGELRRIGYENLRICQKRSNKLRG